MFGAEHVRVELERPCVGVRHGAQRVEHARVRPLEVIEQLVQLRSIAADASIGIRIVGVGQARRTCGRFGPAISRAS